jgi:hypothetical protein
MEEISRKNEKLMSSNKKVQTKELRGESPLRKPLINSTLTNTIKQNNFSNSMSPSKNSSSNKLNSKNSNLVLANSENCSSNSVTTVCNNTEISSIKRLERSNSSIKLASNQPNQVMK